MAMQQQEMWGKKGERRRRCGAGRGTRATEMWGREGVQEQKGRCGAAPLYWWPRPAPTGGSPVPCPAPAPQWNMWHPGHRDMWATRSPETCQPPSSSPTPVTHLHPERSRHAGGSRVATSLVPVLGAASKWEQQQEGKGEDEVGGVSRGQQGGVKWGSNQGTLTPFLTVTLPKSQASPKGCGGGSPQVGGDR